MPKLKADAYRLTKNEKGVPVLGLRDEKGRAYEFEIPLRILYELADSLSKASRSLLPQKGIQAVSERNRPRDDSRLGPERAPLGPSFETGTNEEMTMVMARLSGVNSDGRGMDSMTLLLPPADAALMVDGLRQALDLVTAKQTGPSN